MLNKVPVFVAVLLLGCFTSTLRAAPSEIYLLRHAEKLTSKDKDPRLSPCGVAQAQAMAKLIPGSLSTIYHSGYQRTRQTAQQIGLTQPGAKIDLYNAADLAHIVTRIQQQDAAVLVVGHSNTTPELVHLLSKLTAPTITEQDYGVVYQLKHSEQGYSLFSFSIKQPSICLSSKT